METSDSFLTETQLRLGFFLGTLLIIGLWEKFWPRRQAIYSRIKRWPGNLGIVVVNTILIRLIFPATAVTFASYCYSEKLGLLNIIELPTALNIIIAVVALDFFIYLQHVMFHAIPAFWRLHRVHHADPDYDVTTGLRFHPIEIILSMVIKFAAILLLGPPIVAVIIFEILLNATAMFNHGNIAIPVSVDKFLRLFVVTPDMHRVHHSIEDDETNSNFGFNLPWWDRLFGTYKDQPDAGHQSMTIGLRTTMDRKKFISLSGILAIPFRKDEKSYALNRRNWNKPGE